MSVLESARDGKFNAALKVECLPHVCGDCQERFGTLDQLSSHEQAHKAFKQLDAGREDDTEEQLPIFVEFWKGKNPAKMSKTEVDRALLHLGVPAEEITKMKLQEKRNALLQHV